MAALQNALQSTLENEKTGGINVNNVVSIEDRRTPQSDIVQELTALLAHAKAGNISGMAIAWRDQHGKHCGVTVGTYATDHLAALGAATKLWSQINDAHDLSQ